MRRRGVGGGEHIRYRGREEGKRGRRRENEGGVEDQCFFNAKNKLLQQPFRCSSIPPSWIGEETYPIALYHFNILINAHFMPEITNQYPDQTVPSILLLGIILYITLIIN